MGSSILGAALEYATAGHRVFPIWGVKADGSCHCGEADCSSPGKHPIGRLVPQGLIDASDDPGTIEAWWRQYPDANVGLVTGEQFFVIDGDKHEGVDGTALFLHLAEARGGLPETACADTGGGGAHFCFAMDPDVSVRNQQGLLVDGVRVHGIDVRGEGGYIVAAPSVHASGRVYAWQHDLEHLKAAPGWLLALVAGIPAGAAAPEIGLSTPGEGMGSVPLKETAQSRRADPESGRTDRAVEPLELEQIKAALEFMPPNSDRQTWLERVSMPLHDLFGGSEVGFQLWLSWCATGDGMVTPNGKRAYDGEQACRKIWRSFHAFHRNPKGPATFWQYAYECGWRAPEVVGTNGKMIPGPVPGTLEPSFDPEELAEASGGPTDPGPFPESIALGLDGPIAEMIEWMVEAARRPDRTIALAASLAVVAGAIGRRVIGPGETRATLTLAVLAPSGSGKDRPQACIKNLFDSHPNLCLGLMDDTPTHRTQLDDLLLKSRGQVLMVLDEYGSTLQRWLRSSDMASASMSPTVRRLATHDLTVYRLAPVSLRHPSRAANVAAWDAGIFAPSFSLVGFTTPGQFYEALSESSLTDGFLGRHVVISSRSTADLRTPRASPMKAPSGVLAWLESVEGVPIPQVGPPLPFRPKKQPGSPVGPPDMAPTDPRVVDWASADAEAAWTVLSRELDRAAHKAIADGDETLGAILRRLPGQTMILALVLACGEANRLPEAVVTERHLDLAYRVCRWSADHLAWRLRQGVASDAFGKALGRLCETIERRSPSSVYRGTVGMKLWLAPHIDRIWPLILRDPRFVATGQKARLRRKEDQ